MSDNREVEAFYRGHDAGQVDGLNAALADIKRLAKERDDLREALELIESDVKQATSACTDPAGRRLFQFVQATARQALASVSKEMNDICEEHGPYSTICKQCDLEEGRADSDYFAGQLQRSKKREAVLVKALNRLADAFQMINDAGVDDPGRPEQFREIEAAYSNARKALADKEG